MPLIIALLKINITLALCYLLYRVLLRRLTFYNLNRVFFLCAIALGGVMPLIDIRLDTPATQQPVILNVAATYRLQTAMPATFGYTDLVRLVFWSGVALMSLRFLLQLLSVLRLYLRSEHSRYKNTALRILPAEASPFSFFRSIFLYPGRLSADELSLIITHEQVHTRQWHSIDILLGELKRIFCWFNPAAWLLVRDMRQNLEFIADRAVLRQGAAPRSYQYSLLRVSQNSSPVALANNFNFSNLKTRIIMMNKKRSSPIHAARYLVAAPLALALVCSFGISMGQQKKLTLRETPQQEQRTPAKAAQAQVVTLKIDKAHPGKVKSVRITGKENPVDPTQKERVAVVEMESGASREVALDKPAQEAEAAKAVKPLILLDGTKISTSEMSDLDPQKIKSITVLKDEADVRQYGDEARDGVILIRTKKAGE